MAVRPEVHILTPGMTTSRQTQAAGGLLSQQHVVLIAAVNIPRRLLRRDCLL